MDNVTRLLGGDVERDESWSEPYRGGTKPSPDRGDYPSKDALITAYTDACAALRRSVREAGEGKLEEAVTMEGVSEYFPTLGRWTAHVILAEGAFHTGQLSAWRRAKGMPSVFEAEGNAGRMAASALTV